MAKKERWEFDPYTGKRVLVDLGARKRLQDQAKKQVKALRDLGEV